MVGGCSPVVRLAVVVLAVFSATVAAQSRDPRFFHTRHFWDGFESGFTDAGLAVQKRLDDNLETVMDHLSNLGDSIGSFSRRLEDQVQDSLPKWLQGQTNKYKPFDSEGVLLQDSPPVEAIIGSLGGMPGVDDSIKVYFEGDSDQDELPSPHIIPKESLNSFLYHESHPSSSDYVPPPRTGGPLFDSSFGFRGTFPMFPGMPNFGVRAPFMWPHRRSQPWWKGANVCVDETEIDESETADDEPEVEDEVEGEVKGDVDDAVDDGLVEDDGGLPTEKNKAMDAEEQEEAERERLMQNDERLVERNPRFFFFGQMEIKSCSDDREKYICTTRTRRRGINRTIHKVHRCCHGYVRQSNGCTKVEMVPIPESLERLQLTDFLSLVKSAGMVDMLGYRNLTLFAPNNEAVQDFTGDLTERDDFDITDNEVLRRKRSSSDVDLKSIVKTHLLEGFMYAGDMEDEQILSSLQSNGSLRINVYRSEVPSIVTVNCARMTTVNQHSSNGVVHTIDRVIEPATRSIGDIIGSKPQFSVLKKLVSTSGLLEQLRAAGQLTLFAPTDAAFATLPEGELEALIAGSACLPAVLKNHLLPNVICSAAVTTPVAKTVNLLDKYLKIRLTETGKLFVEDAQIVAKDIMATNGVIHIIDAPLIPQEAKPVMEVLRLHNLTRFLDLLELAELTKEMAAYRDVAVFAPSNAAFEALEEDYLLELKSDPGRLREVLRYHVTTTPLTPADIRNNHVTDTMAGHPLRLNLYSGPLILSISNLLRPAVSRMRMTAACGRVSLLDSRSCGASVHIVDTLLRPAKHDVLKILERDPSFSIFYKIAKGSSLAKELIGPGPLTVLAPSDHVFRTLPKEELESLLADDGLKEELVQRHVLREHICCSGITSNAFPFSTRVRSIHGATLNLHLTHSGLLRAGPARITHCAHPTHNGVVHTVNRLFVEPHIAQQAPSSRWGNDNRAIILNLFGGHH